MKNLTRVINTHFNNKDKTKTINENPKPSRELLEALKESEDIINGKIESKGYTNIDELFKDLDLEI